MIIGHSKDATIYDPDTGTFSNIDNSSCAHKGAGCALYYSPIHMNRPTVFIGGSSDSPHENCAEVLDYTTPNSTWEKLPDIPIEPGKTGIMTRALPTQNENGIYFFHDTKIYELICNSTSCEWGINSQRKSVAASGWPVVMYISSKFIDDICIDCAVMPTFMRDATRFVTSEIVGGHSAPSPIPWQVSIQGVNCGGTILDAYTVLSAGHCFD